MDTHDLRMPFDKENTANHIEYFNAMQNMCMCVERSFAIDTRFGFWFGLASPLYVYRFFFHYYSAYMIYIFSKETPCHFHWVWAQNQHSNAIINDAIKINIDRKCAHTPYHQRLLMFNAAVVSSIEKSNYFAHTRSRTYGKLFSFWCSQLIIHSHISRLQNFYHNKAQINSAIRSLWHQLRILLFHSLLARRWCRCR